MRPSPPPPPASLETLLRGVAGGDATAIDRWFRADHPVVFRLCFGFLADHAEAEDQAQDAMLHLLDALPARDPSRAYAPWRSRVVLNLCRDRLRRRASRARAEDAADALPERLPDPGRAAEQREVQEALRRALACLSDREREVFVLRELEGAPTEEVAESLGVAASTVRSLGTLARRRLRGVLSRRLPGYAPDAPDARDATDAPDAPDARESVR